ncbi:hypothetical protein P4257_22565 [Bacillus thuringiensis]|nr:hypothetical protein [Bacillus thuringiensis]MED2812224.1 hypothetical protein [Bacillus thuringiensis]MED2829118.1 hypothetical protein [Bacillus thuringiensis]MED2831317.1 hypothetical protein [Bacillus thuringiensis]MED2858347.1 hypothetical protein [Bacillus thuringiensis]
MEKKQLVLDTNILIKAFKDFDVTANGLAYNMPNNEKFELAIDYDNKIIEEFNDNLKDSIPYQKWIQSMYTNNQVVYKDGKLDRKIKGKLNSLGFHEPEDQIFVAVALQSQKTIVTEDSDYGKGAMPKAIEKKPVLDYMNTQLGMTVLDSEEGLEFVKNNL